MESKTLSSTPDCLAPDHSEIRLLAATGRVSTVHCSLPAGQASLAVAHKSVEEIWYFLEGQGEVWRRQGDDEEVTAAVPGVSLTIPTGTHFQFRNTGAAPLRFLCVTVPAWPGEDEAYRVKDYWAVDS
ncbi:MAG: cupin domain-containing protein [Acidobacteria bacterium]|nr:cupin domain-containing protein [Acidobacteriota bacterium]